MRTVFAAPPAHRPFPVACMAALAVPSAFASVSADPDPTDIHPPDARVPLYGAASPITITTNSDSSLTAAQTTQTVTLTAARAHVAFVATIGRKRSTARNFVAAEDALKYASSLPIRKRFTCDCNSVFAARSFKASQTLHGLGYTDRLPLSNPHGLSVVCLPRGSSALPVSRTSPTSWMPPHDIEHVEVPYGAVFAPCTGNATGSSVRIATARKPRRPDAPLDTQFFQRHYDAPYGFAKTPGGADQAVDVGDPIARFAYQPTLDGRLESDSRQSQYVSPNSSYNAKPFAAAVPVPGAGTDVRPNAEARVIVDARTLAHTHQPNQVARMGSAAIIGRLGARLAALDRRSNRHGYRSQEFRSDTAGHGVYTGDVKSGGTNDTIAWTTFAPQIDGELKWSL
jgi:iron complex outermembrane receptor protein